MLARISRLSVLWKVLLSTSIALTLLFAATGWIVVDSATRTRTQSVDAKNRENWKKTKRLFIVA